MWFLWRVDYKTALGKLRLHPSRYGAKFRSVNESATRSRTLLIKELCIQPVAYIVNTENGFGDEEKYTSYCLRPWA